MSTSPTPQPRPPLRLWPVWIILSLAAGVHLFAQLQSSWPFQRRNLVTLGTVVVDLVALLLWWMLGSRLPWKTRFQGLALLLLSALGILSVFRLKGVSGDFVPIVEARWKGVFTTAAPSPVGNANSRIGNQAAAQDFFQFLGPNRNGKLTSPKLSTQWSNQPPRLVWRQPIGGGWSGFALVGDLGITQEQHGPEEWVTAYVLTTGQRLWAHTNTARYDTTIAGEGPRATPTVVSNRVYALGATGMLDCLDLRTGRLLWSRNIALEAQRGVPEWGYAGSPWVDSKRVVVQAGGQDGRTLLAFHPESGAPLWNAGNQGYNYSSPYLASISGRSQFLLFEGRNLVSHDPETGKVLWEYPFGTGMPLVANPILISSNRILITAGYNVGAELLEMRSTTEPPVSLWKSKKLKAKFANPVYHEGFVYGLDDGILACIDVRDGSQLWKEGRYGHGQGLWVQDLYLLLSETGELVLLRPTPKGAHELARQPVLDSKTWNPIALQDDRLVIRNDREAVCLQLSLN